MTRADLLDRLLAVTPPAPPPEAEPEVLMRAALDVVDARDRVLADSGVHDANELAGPRDEGRLAELAKRTAAWADALATHRDRVGLTRAGFAKAKAYRQNRQR